MKDEKRYVTLYTKSGCRLCADALDLLLSVNDEAGGDLIIREVDILEDEVLYARFRHRIPVMQFDPDDGGPTFYAPFTVTDLRQALDLDRDSNSATGQIGASGAEFDAQGELL